MAKVQISAAMPTDPNPVHTKPSEPVAADSVELAVGPAWTKMAILAVSVAVLLLIVYCSPLRQYLGRMREVSAQIRGFGAMAPLVLMSGVGLLVACGFPRLVFCLIAGMALGFWSGLFWGQLGTLIGNYSLFMIARAFGRDWAPQFLGRRKRVLEALQRRGALGVFLARQLPLPGVAINLTCALLPIGQLDFLLGTAIGQLPQAIPSTLIGAGALQTSFGKSVGLIGLAVVLSVFAWFVVHWVLRRVPAR